MDCARAAPTWLPHTRLRNVCLPTTLSNKDARSPDTATPECVRCRTNAEPFQTCQFCSGHLTPALCICAVAQTSAATNSMQRHWVMCLPKRHCWPRRRAQPLSARTATTKQFLLQLPAATVVPKTNHATPFHLQPVELAHILLVVVCLSPANERSICLAIQVVLPLLCRV